MLSFQLEKPDLWDDPVYAGRISREHGSLMGKMKEVNGLEQELLEHIDMIKLAREEDDPDLESESVKALLRMRQNVKEKELEALLVGEHDSCSCYIEVQAGAGGTESMDWAGMVMQMYKLWAQRRGYGVDVVDEMCGEIAGIKEVVGGFVAWPKDQVIFIDDGEKITPPHTITNVADMKAPRGQKRTANIVPNSLRKMARPNTKTQKSLNL